MEQIESLVIEDPIAPNSSSGTIFQYKPCIVHGRVGLTRSKLNDFVENRVLKLFMSCAKKNEKIINGMILFQL